MQRTCMFMARCNVKKRGNIEDHKPIIYLIEQKRNICSCYMYMIDDTIWRSEEKKVRNQKKKGP